VGHVVIELGFVGDDLHGPTAEDEAGAHQDGVADVFGDLAGLGGVAGDAVGGLLEVELLEEGAELFAVAGGVDGFYGGAEDGDAGVF
jgi:hypothetical protein